MTPGSETLLPLLVHIQTHLDDDLSLDTLSRRARLSPSRFHRLFKATIGETPKEYTTRLRLELGAFRLLIQEATLLDIALDCGYHNHETFTRAFCKHFGVTPQAYRTQARHALPQSDEAVLKPGNPHATQFELSTTRVIRLRELHLAFLRHVGPYEAVPQALYDDLARWALRRGMPRPWVWLGIGHDAPITTPPDRLRFDAALVVPGPFELDGSIGHQVLAGGDFAVTKHAGPLATLPDAYAVILPRVLSMARYRLVGLPAVEMYQATDLNLGHPVQHTDICLPVVPRPAPRRGR